MFPIPWNKAYRKKDGGLTIIDDMFVDVPELEEEIDALDERLTTAEGDIDGLETAVGRVADSVTPISQSGTTATAAITSGKYFYLDGVLVKAITNIAIDDTFTEDTNYEVVSAGGLNDLKGMVDSIEGNLSGGYTFLGVESVVLATADGLKTASELMTEALTALQAIVPSTEMPGATHMQIVNAYIPYGSGGSSRTALIHAGGLTFKDSYSDTTLLAFFKITTTTNGANVWVAEFGSTNKWFIQNITTQEITDLATRKPANGTALEIRLEFYKQIT